MPSYMAANQSAPVVLPPPAVLSNRKDAEAWFLTRTGTQRQSFMNYVINTVNSMSPARKRGFSQVLAKQGLTMDMMRKDLPGMNGLGAVMDFASLATSLYLAKDAQDDAADAAAANTRLQRQLNKDQIASNERMNQALIDAKTAAAAQASSATNQANELQAYTQILGMQMKADTDAKRREMFGPIWGRVIQWGAIGALVIGGGATYMYFRKKRRK